MSVTHGVVREPFYGNPPFSSIRRRIEPPTVAFTHDFDLDLLVGQTVHGAGHGEEHVRGFVFEDLRVRAVVGAVQRDGFVGEIQAHGQRFAVLDIPRVCGGFRDLVFGARVKGIADAGEGALKEVRAVRLRKDRFGGCPDLVLTLERGVRGDRVIVDGRNVGVEGGVEPLHVLAIVGNRQSRAEI